MLIATAGHVDHGKTALVRALTGVDTDRLPEEKARGLTIDLGFAYLHEEPGPSLGFVDVPGHERFVRNMLAGVAAIDWLLLVVAADDGPMPQTLEHFAIACLLGIRHAAVVVSKIDRVTGPRVAEVKQQLAELLAASPVGDAPVFPVSALSGAGVSELRAFLGVQARELSARDTGGCFRLPIDRSFSAVGAGRIVTGAVFNGLVKVGDTLQLQPGAGKVRVRGIHSQGTPATKAVAGERCALNIVGPGLQKMQPVRGDWLLGLEQDVWSQRVDVTLNLLPSESGPLKHWAPVHVHGGAGAVTGRVALLGQKQLNPGRDGLAQLVLDSSIHAVYGDALVLRDQSARRTIGGARVIDPEPVKRGRGKPARVELLRRIDTPVAADALQALLAAEPSGVDLRRFAAARNLSDGDAERLFSDLAPVHLDSDIGGAAVAISSQRWQTLSEKILTALGEWHERNPQSLGPAAAVLRQSCSPEEHGQLFAAVLQRLIRHREIARQGTLLHLPAHRPQLSTTERAQFDRIMALLGPTQTKPLAVKDLAAKLEMVSEKLRRQLDDFAARGLLVRVSSGRFFHGDAIDLLAQRCYWLADESRDGLFDVRQFRDAAGIGRNAAIDVLEYFDSIAITQRLGERRRLHPQAARSNAEFD